ncbi:hypothetical protein GALMADRAFT_1365217 [Galerina marginata CBS 339.88]|uniref:Uncharacterized protein n=1 Tax=Galerina marginata (strain CBS 339.88) TaxID=685588 RepID=A0A067T6J7_GALM3|nr:hypothetical protein GALMADRAFT_1365217 [Galerina marginata CBS 339.88]
MSLSRNFILNYFSRPSSESFTNAIHHEVGRSTSGSRESNADPAPRAKDPTSNWAHLVSGVYKLATTLYTFGLHLLLYKQMAFRFGNLPRQTNAMSPCDRALELMTGDFAGYDHWNANITQITRMWKIARKGCAFIVPISLALFQASRSLKAAESVDFWVFYSQPISSLVWSTFFCGVTIFIAVWTHRSDAISESTGQLDWSVVTSAAFLTLLIVVQAVRIHRGMKFFSQK